MINSKKNIVLNEQPNISDSEIDVFRDFDSVLKRRNLIARANRRGRYFTSLTAGSLIVVIAVGLIYWYDPGAEGENATSNPEQAPSAAIGEGRQETVRPVAPLEETPQMPPDQPEGSGRKEEMAVSSDQSGSDNTQTPAKQERTGQLKAEEEATGYHFTEAEPQEGFPALYAYFDAALTYPLEALKDSLEGTVLVQFTIDRQGKPQDLKVIQSLGKYFDDEALKVVQSMPQWKPATVNGTPVESRISIPLSFQIED